MQVQVQRPDGLVVAVLGKGNFFGEMALFQVRACTPPHPTPQLGGYPPRASDPPSRVCHGAHTPPARYPSHACTLPSLHALMRRRAAALLSQEDLNRNCSVGAISICDMYRLDTAHVRPVLDGNPALKQALIPLPHATPATCSYPSPTRPATCFYPSPPSHDPPRAHTPPPRA